MKHLEALWRTILGVLMHLSDQTAYQRHLAHHGRAHSADEWRQFSSAHLARKYFRPKCC